MIPQFYLGTKCPLDEDARVKIKGQLFAKFGSDEEIYQIRADEVTLKAGEASQNLRQIWRRMGAYQMLCSVKVHDFI